MRDRIDRLDARKPGLQAINAVLQLPDGSPAYPLGLWGDVSAWNPMV